MGLTFFSNVQLINSIGQNLYILPILCIIIRISKPHLQRSQLYFE